MDWGEGMVRELRENPWERPVLIGLFVQRRAKRSPAQSPSYLTWFAVQFTEQSKFCQVREAVPEAELPLITPSICSLPALELGVKSTLKAPPEIGTFCEELMWKPHFPPDPSSPPF